jgi:hypothetical protein
MAIAPGVLLSKYGEVAAILTSYRAQVERVGRI